MAYRSFRKFLDALDEAGELKRVAVPVDTDLLIAEWADREMKSPAGGKALLFEQAIVDGKKTDLPVAINTMGSRKRMALALQVADVVVHDHGEHGGPYTSGLVNTPRNAELQARASGSRSRVSKAWARRL